MRMWYIQWPERMSRDQTELGIEYNGKDTKKKKRLLPIVLQDCIIYIIRVKIYLTVRWMTNLRGIFCLCQLRETSFPLINNKKNKETSLLLHLAVKFMTNLQLSASLMMTQQFQKFKTMPHFLWNITAWYARGRYCLKTIIIMLLDGFNRKARNLDMQWVVFIIHASLRLTFSFILYNTITVHVARQYLNTYSYCTYFAIPVSFLQ